MNWFALFISSTFFTGFLGKYLGKPGAGGGHTGSVVGLLILVLIYEKTGSLTAASISILISLILGVIFVERAERFMLVKWGPRIRHTGELVEHDFNQTNIDEVHGQLIAGFPLFFFSPLGMWAQMGLFLLSFILFRGFDMTKPGPIKWFEKIPGVWGIMLDDTVAGVISALIILAIRFAI